MTERKKVLVLYGGQSTEHEVSRRSAAYVWRHIDRQHFDAYAIAISKEGRWLAQNRQELEREMPKEMPMGPTEQADPASQKLLQSIWTPGEDRQDLIVFNIIHGTSGEDGALQGFFELKNLAYVGPSVLGSAIAMDKIIAKQLVSLAGIRIVPYQAMRWNLWQEHRSRCLALCQQELDFPMFVKPASLGSSVGVKKAKNLADLEQAIDFAFRYDEQVLVESGIDAREIEFACLGGYDPQISAPGEIAVPAGFYSYEEKYSAESHAEVMVPAQLTAPQTQEGQDMARRIFTALQLHGLARIDLFLCKKTGVFYFNEANTLPGMTAISQYPKLWEHAGYSGQSLISTLLNLAWQRRQHQRSLLRSL